MILLTFLMDLLGHTTNAISATNKCYYLSFHKIINNSSYLTNTSQCRIVSPLRSYFAVAPHRNIFSKPFYFPFINGFQSRYTCMYMDPFNFWHLKLYRESWMGAHYLLFLSNESTETIWHEGLPRYRYFCWQKGLKLLKFQPFSNK